MMFTKCDVNNHLHIQVLNCVPIKIQSNAISFIDLLIE